MLGAPIPLRLPRLDARALHAEHSPLLGLKAEQIAAAVDTSGRGPGTHQLEVTVRAPAGTSVALVSPARVNVVLRSK